MAPEVSFPQLSAPPEIFERARSLKSVKNSKQIGQKLHCVSPELMIDYLAITRANYIDFFSIPKPRFVKINKLALVL
ncbi:hypothetical protein MiSe_24270 [Microseira wollei NIES-4236]|uniref:Uncharacterized protein n=1 Tax=Microseira wollei NIES-4236 TaxID=2530354 RepID=A0AAV3X5W7_9CYAN|nr:hypothetical protein MiSe_24270 [Microseira wollei NIES-4236]